MSITKYQEQLNDDFNYYFAYTNNPVYYTCVSNSSLTEANYYYTFTLNVNKQDGSFDAETISTSKIYPQIVEVSPDEYKGYGVYNPMRMLRRYTYDPWFQPDELSWTFPQTIRNIRVDVSQSVGLTGTTMYNKAFIISGYDIMKPEEYRVDGTYAPNYVLDSNTSKMFSKQEGFRNKLNINERCSLRLIQGKMKYDDSIYSRIENIRLEVTKSSGYKYRYKWITDNTQMEWWNDTNKYQSDNEKLQTLTGMMVDLPVGPWNLLNNGLDNTGIYTNKYLLTAYDLGSGWVTGSTLATAENIVEVGDTYTIEAYAEGYGDDDITSQSYEFEVVCSGQYTPYELA